MLTLQSLLRPTGNILHPSPAQGSTDAQLLARFRAGDDAAFERLVWRHGPMVLNVCRRVLNDEHAAEDAFQAAFFELAMKSGSIDRGDAVGGWLCRVAYRLSLRARARAARRKEPERVAGLARAERPAPDPGAGLAWQELRPHLESEIERLPAEYRTAFVLCHVEGKTNEEAARELGCPVGTVQSRLSRARARLRARLRKRNLGLEAIPFFFFTQRRQAARRAVRRFRRATLTLLLFLALAAAVLIGGLLWAPPLVPVNASGAPGGAACHARPAGAP